MTPQKCPRCERAVPEGNYMCGECAADGVRDLTRSAYFLRHLDEKRARVTSRLWTGGSRPSREQPLPYDPRVRHVAIPARNTLTTWARLIIAEHGCTDLPDPVDSRRVDSLTRELDAWDALAGADYLQPNDRPVVNAMRTTVRDDLDAARQAADLRNLAVVAEWIGEHCAWATSKPWAHDLFDAAHTLKDSLEALFDNPPETVALGTCGNVHATDDDDAVTCAHILAAPVGDTQHQCPRCGHIHDVQRRRLDLLKRADDLSVTVTDATRLLRMAGHDQLSRQTVHRVVLHFGIESTSVVQDKGRPARRYPLGAIREGVDLYHEDRDTRRNVNRADKVGATLSA